MSGGRDEHPAPRRACISGAATLLTIALIAGVGAAPASAAPARSIASACGSASQPLVDLPRSNPHHPGVSCLYLWEVATGPRPGRYSPSLPVTRAQMATFIARLLTEAGASLPSSPPRAFSDVPPGSTHERSINQLAAVGIVSGRQGRYDPNGRVSRAQMASFIMRAAELVAGGPLPTGGNAFVDDDGNVHEANINRAAAAGIAEGTSGARFDPSGDVTRAQMGSFLARLLALFVDDHGVPPRAPVDDPPFGPPYRFIVPPGAFGNSTPGRWNPCAAPSIPWRIVGPSRPEWDRLVTDAVADASTATRFTVPRNQGFTGSRRLDIEFRPGSEFPPDVIGMAQPTFVGTPGGGVEIISARIRFNTDFLDLVTDPAAGAAGAEAAQILMLHEVGHAFGLDHVDDPQLLMAPSLDPDDQEPYYGFGELDGLALVGASQGCVPR